MSFAASIVTYHTPLQELHDALDVLSRSSAQYITVVDHSNNDSLASVAARYPKVEYIQQKNRGYGAGHNIAIRKSLERGMDLHLVMNSDVVMVPADIDRLAEYMMACTDVGAIHPQMLNPDGSMQYSVRLCPTPADLILRRFLPARMMKKRRYTYELRHIDHTKEANVPYMQGSFMMLSCRILEQTGLFDERFFLYPEDIDLSRRIHRVARTIYYPGVKAIHQHRAASYHSVKMLAIHVVNMIRYFNKWGWIIDPERRRFNAPFILNTKTAPKSHGVSGAEV